MLLGLDIGSTFVKAVLFDGRGRKIKSACRRVPVRHPRPGWVERDAGLTWRLTATAMRAAIGSQGASVTAVGVTGCGNGAVFLDAAGRPLRAGILSSDTRAASAARGRTKNSGGQAYPGQMAELLRWVRAREPQTVRRLHRVLFWKDFIRLKLTGRAATDFTDAGASGLLDGRRKRWHRREAALPELQESFSVAGGVTAPAARATGLRPGTPVVTGCIDCEAAAIGSGVERPDELSVVAGTWSINQAFAPNFPGVHRASRLFLCNPSAVPGRWLLLEGSPTSASHFDWFVRAVCGAADFSRVAALAAASPPGELLFLPGLFSGRAAFVGLAPQHGVRAMARAVMEGVAFSHRAHVERLVAAGRRFRGARLAGGAAHSPFWCQLFADVLGLRVEVPAVDEPGALGAALVAGVGIHRWPSLRAAQARMVRATRSFRPDRRAGVVLNRKYARFRALAVLPFP